MDRADILSGSAFKAALWSVVFFVVVLTLGGALAVRGLTNEMTDLLRAQVTDMETTLGFVERNEGAGRLVPAVTALSRASNGRLFVHAIYDAAGVRLVGNIDVVLPAGQWSTLRLDPDNAGMATYILHAQEVGPYLVVTGRNTDVIALGRQSIIRGFAIAGFIVVLSILVIGYLLSRNSQTSLERMEAALDRVAHGETEARIETGAGNDQIDRIARRINDHLDQLDVLFHQTQRTAASVAHDLRRPLARATLGIERALVRVEAGGDARGEIEQSLADLSQLQSVIASILRIARIESGELGVMKPFDLCEVLDEVADTYVPVAEDAAQHLVYARGDAPLMVYGDPEMLAQLVVNLVQNAITHAGDGATIRMDANTSGGAVNLSVADNGPGIPPDLRARVFEPFYRADAARSLDGNGLGLALVRAIADRHGGTLGLEDADPGLRVTLCLRKLANS